MSKPTVLISGAGIAGIVCAHFLARAGIHSTIIERYPSLRTTGQQIDFSGVARTIIERMGVLPTVLSKTTKEAGFAFIDETGKRLAEFPVIGGDKGASFTSEIEILRGVLTRVFYDATQEGVEYVFGDHVTGLEEVGGKVKVDFEKGERREFDIVLGADGQGSKTRRLVFGEEESAMKPLGQYVAYFTIPLLESDRQFSEWLNAPGGRGVLTRPDNAGYTRAYLTVTTQDPSPKLAEYYKLSVDEQKALLHEIFADVGWETPRILKDMDTSEDFYMQSIAQIKLPSWSRGHIALLGDAGYCPSPISGMGTSVAIVGGYVLAGEIAKHGMDVEKAFSEYERITRPYVEKAQSLPPGAPAIVNPQTTWGIAVLRAVVGFAAWSGLAALLGKVVNIRTGERIDMPEYKFGGGAVKV